MGIRIVFVLHGKKQEGSLNAEKQLIMPREAAINPPMTFKAVADMVVTAEEVLNDPRVKESGGGVVALYSSRLARALDAASVFAEKLDMDIKTLEDLGQRANLESGVVTKMNEEENVASWQSSAQQVARSISFSHDDDAVVIATTHRPIAGGLLASARGIDGKTDLKALDDFIHGPELGAMKYIVLDCTADGTVTEVPLSPAP